MFNRRTLFVVGAGASAEVGLPVGTKLASTIATMLDIRFDEFGQRRVSGDADLFSQFLQFHPNELNDYQSACWLIRDGVRLSNSIDDFLDVYSQNQRVKEVGKTAVVKAILEAERDSKLFYDKSNIYNKMDMSVIEDTWFIKFIRMLGRGVPLDRVESIFDKVAFIVFNYDRCIEHFLFLAIRQLYSLDERSAGLLMDKLSIIHPYGVVANIPHSNRNGVDFGGGPDRLTAPYLELSKRIRTYTEQIKDPDEIKVIQEKVMAAEKVVFLGFAFHDQNLQLLKPERGAGKQFFATAFGLSPYDVSVISEKLLELFKTNRSASDIFIDNQHKCSDLFDFYSKSLPA